MHTQLSGREKERKKREKSVHGRNDEEKEEVRCVHTHQRDYLAVQKVI